MIIEAGILFIIEVVNESDDAPEFFVIEVEADAEPAANFRP